jgi:hypothetical protein
VATFTEFKKSFSVLQAAKTRDQLPSCKRMEKFINVITSSKPTWSAEDQGAFTKMVSEQMPELVFDRFQNRLRNIAGLTPITFEKVVKGKKCLEEELALLRADVEKLKEAMARKGKAKKTKQPELPM